jgi:hypothetical protein
MASDVTSPAGSAATAAGGEAAAAEPQAEGASEQPLRELSFVKLPIWQEVLGRGLLLYVAGFVLTVVVSAQAEQHWVEHALFGAILGFILLFVTIGFRWVRARHAPPQLCVQIFRDYLFAPGRTTSIGSTIRIWSARRSRAMALGRGCGWARQSASSAIERRTGTRRRRTRLWWQRCGQASRRCLAVPSYSPGSMSGASWRRSP